MQHKGHRCRCPERCGQNECPEAERQQALDISIHEMTEEQANAEYHEGRRRLGGANDDSPCIIRIGLQAAEELPAGFRRKEDLEALRRTHAGQESVLGCSLRPGEQILADSTENEPDYPRRCPKNGQNSKFFLVQGNSFSTATMVEQSYGKRSLVVQDDITLRHRLFSQ